MYRCETWTLPLKEENKLLVAERKIFRQILGTIKREFGNWWARFNREIKELVSEVNVIGEIKSGWLRWLDYVERMGVDRAAEITYLEQTTGRRAIGRPRYCWRDGIAKDLKELIVPKWSKLAQNRKYAYFDVAGHFGLLNKQSKKVCEQDT